jgi:hypothetical protein
MSLHTMSVIEVTLCRRHILEVSEEVKATVMLMMDVIYSWVSVQARRVGGIVAAASQEQRPRVGKTGARKMGLLGQAQRYFGGQLGSIL